MQWEKLESSGKPPCARYQHSMHFYEKMNFLCIYGGKGETAENEILNDLHLLRMDNLMWIKVKLRGMKLGGRANFASCFHLQSKARNDFNGAPSHKLIIFGGIKENMSYSNDTFVLEFNQAKIREVVKKEKELKERLKLEQELMLLEAKKQFQEN